MRGSLLKQASGLEPAEMTRERLTLRLPAISDERGALAFIEGGQHVPFPIARVYYLFDVPFGTRRGQHAHKALQQVLIAVSGSFDVELDDGISKSIHRLNDPRVGLHIPPMFWRSMLNFSPNAVCLVLASQAFSESDYIRSYSEFLSIVNRSR